MQAAADPAVTTRQAAGSEVPTRPLDGAECAICFDELTDGASAAQRAIATCASCGNHLHKEVCTSGLYASLLHLLDTCLHVDQPNERLTTYVSLPQCFAKWAAAKQGSVTCPYCRSAWAMPTAAAGAGPSAAGGYMNLSQYSEDHRNTQTLEDLYGEPSIRAIRRPWTTQGMNGTLHAQLSALQLKLFDDMSRCAGATAVWINHHARGGNARHAVR